MAAKAEMDLINCDAGVGENESDLNTEVAKHPLNLKEGTSNGITCRGLD